MTAVEQQGDAAPPVRFLDAWDARREGLTQPAARTGPTPAVLHGPRPRYVAAALADECRQVREAVQGTRNGQLNTSAVKLGRLVGAGLLEEDEARAELTAAARDAGLEPREIGRTISSGLRAGVATPRDPGAPQNNGAGAQPLRDVTERMGAHTPVPVPAPDLSAYLQPAGTFLRALPERPEPVWGRGDSVLWSAGEALMLAGGPGLGKTTLAGQLVRARIGWQPTVLDLPVAEGRHVLYLMMDRPQQIARRLLQQFGTAELDLLDKRLTLGVGPPPQDLARFPDLLPELCARAGADTVVVDSLKDAAIGLTEDEVAAGYNRARQLAITAGVQVLELHHLVKRGGDGKAPTTLADVYGSAWLTAGAGSVLLLTGDAGDPIIKASHLKQPLEPWGPAELSHDHTRGTTTVHHRVDLLQLLAITTSQTARSAACQLFATDKPKAAELEKARRRLEQLVRGGQAVKREPGPGRADATYHPKTARELPAALTLEETP